MTGPAPVRRAPRGRGGFTLVEVLVATLLGLLVLHLAYDTLAAMGRATDDLRRRQELLTARRILTTTIRRELGQGRAGVDWRIGSDSLDLRAFRGRGVVCDAGADSTLLVAYVGDRIPDPRKDSVEVVSADGAIVIAELRSATAESAACPVVRSGESLQRWRLDAPPPASPVLARIFESGEYHLTGSALRYRIGAGGRQPLTAPVWVDTGSSLDAIGPVAAAALRAAGAASGSPPIFLGWRATP